MRLLIVRTSPTAKLFFVLNAQYNKILYFVFQRRALIKGVAVLTKINYLLLLSLLLIIS